MESRLLALVLVTAACGASSIAPPGGGPIDQPEDLDVTVSISGAVLADDCPDEDADMDCSEPCSFCQQSNMQLSFDTGPDSAVQEVQITRVTLLDAGTGEILDPDLGARDAHVWTGEGYELWGEALESEASAEVTYDIGAPDWASIGAAGSTYGRAYRIEVVVTFDGEPVTIRSGELFREAEVDT